tara:strand:- start:2676 stop:2915 length:240 start_codon:yes stop_codon:yes gene_type:complete
VLVVSIVMVVMVRAVPMRSLVTVAVGPPVIVRAMSMYPISVNIDGRAVDVVAVVVGERKCCADDELRIIFIVICVGRQR